MHPLSVYNRIARVSPSAERRGDPDRRSLKDRRQLLLATLQGAERRTGSEQRSGLDRRWFGAAPQRPPSITANPWRKPRRPRARLGTVIDIYV